MNFELAAVMPILQKTPRLLQELLSGLPEPWGFNNEGEGTWSPYDIVGHLIHGEKTDWMPRAKIILSAATNKEFVAFDRFAQMETPAQASLAERLTEFAQLRQANLLELEQMQISSAQLAWTGIHPEFGTVTLAQLLATWVVHDLSHLNQITRVLAKNYQKEIGPWRQYITIVQA